MEIKELIKIFEKCLEYYQEGYNEQYDWIKLKIKYLDKGICFTCYRIFNEHIYQLFYDNNYYGKLNTDDFGYLFPRPNNYKDLLLRINWLKEEIKDLNKLLKKGYTEV